MAYTNILFENPHTGLPKEAPVGFSWTTLFFGFLPAIFRGDWKWAIVMFISCLPTLGLSALIFPFIYNKLYIKDLIGSGYKAKYIASGNMDEASAKIGMKIPMLEEAS